MQTSPSHAVSQLSFEQLRAESHKWRAPPSLFFSTARAHMVTTAQACTPSEIVVYISLLINQV